jgi:hypothetical protein
MGMVHCDIAGTRKKENFRLQMVHKLVQDTAGVLHLFFPSLLYWRSVVSVIHSNRVQRRMHIIASVALWQHNNVPSPIHNLRSICNE